MTRPPPTWFERAAALISPHWAARRYAGRLSFEAASGYEAARRDRPSMRNFNALPGTADQDTLPQLDVQRARSREMLRNQPLATGAVNTVVTNVVGTGLRMSSQVDRAALADMVGVTPDEAASFERQAEREWRMFCRREYCDTTGRNSFSAMQELAFRAVLESGDVLAAMVANDTGPFDFAVQLIEADRIRNPKFLGDSQTLAGGVEQTETGRPIAFHVADLARTTGQPERWRRIEAWSKDGRPRALHLMHQRRIDQSRGVPYLAPVIPLLKELSRYTEAEITAAVLNACLAIMSKSENSVSPLALEAQQAGAPQAGALRRVDIQFEPGMVLEGFQTGEEVRGMPAERPATGFDPFVLAILRQVGVALELPFELLVKHFTASYSAARAALLQAWGFFRMRRAWLADSFCQPVYETVIHNAVVRGRIFAPGFLQEEAIRLAWLTARWTGPSAGQLDPLKEVNAAEKRISLKLSSRTRETAELTGDDWEAVAAELKTEEELIDQLALADAAADPTGPAMPPEPDPPVDQPEAA